jgi:ubiquinone/menaquinone biosynthesis C-methylase UbiE
MSLIEKFSYTLSKKSRERKYAQFLAEIKPKPEESIIDVGVNDEEYSQGDNYLEKHYPYPQNITAISKDSADQFKNRYPEIKAVVADGRKLPFDDNSFDIAYSNAVIEHVGKRKDQIDFLRELFRVARRGYFTTPNRLFPIEIHTRVPLLHLILPKKAFDFFLKMIGKKWATGDYMDLLSKNELTDVIEKAGIKKYKILNNRIFCLPATFTVVWKKQAKQK